MPNRILVTGYNLLYLSILNCKYFKCALWTHHFYWEIATDNLITGSFRKFQIVTFKNRLLLLFFEHCLLALSKCLLFSPLPFNANYNIVCCSPPAIRATVIIFFCCCFCCLVCVYLHVTPFGHSVDY